MIGLSPLTTNHLSIFPHTRVRSSNKRYRLKFNQFMVRSPSFGFYFRNLTAILNLIFFSLHIYLFKLATKINSLIHYTKGTLALLIKLQLIVSIKFQNLFKLANFFSPFLHSTFHYQASKFLDLRVVPQYSNNTWHVSFYKFKNLTVLFYRALLLFPSLAIFLLNRIIKIFYLSITAFAHHYWRHLGWFFFLVTEMIQFSKFLYS